MPSFVRRVPIPTTAPPPGTIPSISATSPALSLLPTGVPSIDDLLAGGIPLGGVYLVSAPDTQTNWSRLIARYWISQGLVTGQKSLCIGEEESMRETVKGCMWIDEREDAEGSESETEGAGMGGDDVNKTKIAWRYERMKKFQTSVSQGGSKELNIMTTVPSDLLDHLEKTGIQQYLPLTYNSGGPSSSTPAWRTLSSVLRSIHDVLSKHPQGSALRISTLDLGSVEWGEPSSQEVHRFLHALRSLIKSRPVAVLVTLPPHLASSSPSGESQEEWMNTLSWGVDALIELRGFGDDPTLPPLFYPLHGLLTIPTFPTTHHLLPPTLKHSSLLGLSAGSGGGGGAGENNLGFRLKRKRFVVETVHLGIEGGTGERRTAPAEEINQMVAPIKSSQQQSNQGVDRPTAPEQNTAIPEGVDRPKGPVEEKKKKPRARVRFGGEEELVPPPEVTVHAGKQGEHDHAHDHVHPHAHSHGNAGRSMAARPTVRHDRPDLYEF